MIYLLCKQWELPFGEHHSASRETGRLSVWYADVNHSWPGRSAYPSGIQSSPPGHTASKRQRRDLNPAHIPDLSSLFLHTEIRLTFRLPSVSVRPLNIIIAKSHFQTHSISSLPQQLLEVSSYNYLRFPERDWLFCRVTLSVSSLQPSCRPWVDFWGFIQHVCDTCGLGLG